MKVKYFRVSNARVTAAGAVSFAQAKQYDLIILDFDAAGGRGLDDLRDAQDVDVHRYHEHARCRNRRLFGARAGAMIYLCKTLLPA